MSDKSTAAILKDQFALIAILVVLIGTVHTESYYAQFGLRYQSLNLPASHIAYRGFTALLGAPYLVVPYLAGVFCLCFTSATPRDDTDANTRIWIVYAILTAILLMVYPLAAIAGTRAAQNDLGTSSKLPIIKRLLPQQEGNNTCDVADRCRLLLVDPDYLYVFVPTDSSSVPHIKRLDRKVFNEIDTGLE